MNATLSFASMVPVAGWTGTAAKWAKSALTVTDATMQTLATGLGGSVAGKTVTFTPSTAESPATLSFGDGECVSQVNDFSTLKEIENELTDDCLKSVYSDLNANDVQNEIKDMFNDVFEDATGFNVVFRDNLQTENLGETAVKEIRKTGDDLLYLDVEINLDASTLSSYSKEYTAFTFIHEMLHAYYFAKPEIFPPSDNLTNPEADHHIGMLSTYLIDGANYINYLYGANTREMIVLSLRALKEQVLGDDPNDVTFNYLKEKYDIDDAEMEAVLSKYIHNGTRCN